MAGGYRVLIVGALAALLLTVFGFGWLVASVSDNSNEQRQQSYRYAADKPLEIDPASSGGADTKPLEYRTPCDNPKGREESDLCAQWKSANAAEDSTFWTKWGFWIAVVGSTLLLWQIILTRRAVEDTGEATNAMKRQNDLAEAAQRPWIRLSAHPTLVQRYGIDGLYIRVDFVGENIGKSPATHFDMETDILFRGQNEDGAAFDARLNKKIEEWKNDYTTGPKAILAPNDVQRGGVWDDFTVPWWDIGIGTKTAHPVLLAAVLYRTPAAPDLVQLSWRTWYLVCLNDDGSVLSFIPFPKGDLGPDKLCVEPMLASMAHEEYESEDRPDQRANKIKMRTVRLQPKE